LIESDALIMLKLQYESGNQLTDENNGLYNKSTTNGTNGA